jgi:hypothetical protein
MKLKLQNGHKIEIITLQEKKEAIDFEKHIAEYHLYNMMRYQP